MIRTLFLGASLLIGCQVASQAQPVYEWHASTPAEKALDEAAFNGLGETIRTHLTDVQSAVVMLRGRVVFEFYRDGSPDTLRDVQSVAKSAISALVGTALRDGGIAGLDQPIVALVPEWKALNSDPRAASITVRHLLTMTAGFEVNDPGGTAAAGRPNEKWARPLRSDPGTTFTYDNALIPMLAAVLEKVSGMPLADYARRQLVEPLGMNDLSVTRGLRMRTLDMARLGQLYLNQGVWQGKAILPADYVFASTRAQNAGGRPVGLAYGLMWWVVPNSGPRPRFIANGFGGQYISVDPAMDMVVAVTSTASPESNERGQALQLMRGRVHPAAQQRLANEAR